MHYAIAGDGKLRYTRKPTGAKEKVLKVDFGLPKEKGLKRFKVKARDGTKNILKFMVYLQTTKDEVGTYVSRASMQRGLEVQYRDMVDGPDSGYYTLAELQDLHGESLNLDEKLGDHWSGRWPSNSQQPRWVRKYRTDLNAVGCLAENLILSAGTEHEAKDLYLQKLGITELEGYRSAFELEEIDPKTEASFPLTVPDADGRFPEPQAKTKKAS